MLKDELSKLPPYNYYLLFAITCHISLLHTQQAENKMDYPNLCICFQPCIRLNAFCFQFLVKHWKDCWQGCWTENEYLQLEAKWDLMELQGDFSGPRTFIENSPYNRNKARGNVDPTLEFFNNLNMSTMQNNSEPNPPLSGGHPPSVDSDNSVKEAEPVESVVLPVAAISKFLHP